MPTFNNGEDLDDVRGKLNNAILRAERTMIVDDVTQLANLVYTADSQWTVSAGMQVLTAKEGFLYDVLASGASTFDIQPGAVKLDVLPSSDGSINFRAMLPAANGTTDDYPLLAKLLAKPRGGTGLYVSGPSIYFPAGAYRMNSTLELKREVRLWSDAGYPSSSHGRLVFAANTAGIVVNRFNTLDGTTQGSPTTAADATVIEGISIESLGGTDRTKHGITIRARCSVKATMVKGFPGNGITVTASAGVGGTAEGNANVFYIENTTCTLNRNHGFYADGADANAGTCIGLDCASNGRFGIYDSSFLGNNYIGCHTATNGLATVAGNSTIQSSLVLYAGNFWIAHWTATEAELVATEPGTDATVWIDRGPGYSNPLFPTWTPGRPEGTYFVAYAYFNEAPTAESVFLGCYSEADGDVAFLGPCLVIGGAMGNFRAGSRMAAGSNNVPSFTTLASTQAGHQAWLTDGSAYETWTGTANAVQETWRWKRTTNGGIQLDNANSGFRIPLRITGIDDTRPWKLNLTDVLIGGRLQAAGTAAPTTGTWERGDYVRNINSAVGQPKGWYCTVAGTPGTWVSEGNL
jgi:hypothetical protein